MNNEINVKIQEAYDTESNWSNINPILLSGQMAISSDKDGMFKVGNGYSRWSQLQYAKSRIEKTDISSALGFTPVKIRYGTQLPSSGTEGEFFLLIE